MRLPLTPDMLRISCEEGVVYVRPTEYPYLQEFGLKTYRDWMSLKQIPFREISMRPVRPVVALQVPGIREQLFLKRNLDPPRKETIKERLGLVIPASEAYREVEAMIGYRNAGIHVPEVIAWGEGVWQGTRGISFVLTRDLEGMTLEKHVSRYWRRVRGGIPFEERRGLVLELATLTRKMHQAGWVHRDFYFGHIFIDSPQNIGKRLSVIDVQRASQRPWWWIRSRIKDLASLHFSADPAYIQCSDRIRFLKAYWQTERLTCYHRILMGWIMRKSARIQRHTEKAMGITRDEYFARRYEEESQERKRVHNHE